MSNKRRSLILGVSVLAASLSLAVQATTPAPPTGVDPKYESAFEGYRPFTESKIQDWRKSNDTVRDIGGWRAYAREINGDGEAPAAKAADQEPSVKPHLEHKR